MKREKQPFFKEEFYEDPTITLRIFNKLIKENQVAAIDMYSSGTFLSMEIYDNEETKVILKPIISDLEAYREYDQGQFVTEDPTQISLCALQDEHAKYFGYDKEIKWNRESEEFVFACMMEDQDK